MSVSKALVSAPHCFLRPQEENQRFREERATLEVNPGRFRVPQSSDVGLKCRLRQVASRDGRSTREEDECCYKRAKPEQ